MCQAWAECWELVVNKSDTPLSLRGQQPHEVKKELDRWKARTSKQCDLGLLTALLGFKHWRTRLQIPDSSCVSFLSFGKVPGLEGSSWCLLRLLSLKSFYSAQQVVVSCFASYFSWQVSGGFGVRAPVLTNCVTWTTPRTPLSFSFSSVMGSWCEAQPRAWAGNCFVHIQKLLNAGGY